MLRLPLILILAAAAAACAVSGCSSSGCTDNQNPLPLAGFFSAETGNAISLSDVDIAGVDAPEDSVLYRSGTARNEVYLPFRANTDNTAWYFHYTQEGIDDLAYNDTIYFRYTSTPMFTTEDCGAMYRYTITSTRYTEHLIDSVAVTDPVITNIDMMRIKIFFRTQPAGSGEEENPDTPGTGGEEEEEEEV